MAFTHETRDDVARRYRTGVVRYSVAAVLLLVLVGILLVQKGYLHFGRPSGASALPSPSPAFDTWTNPNAVPIGYSVAGTPPQEAAEVLPGPAAPTVLTAIQPYVKWWTGLPSGTLRIDVYETPDPRHPFEGPPVATATTDVFGLPTSGGGYVDLPLDRPVTMRPGSWYAFTFATNAATTQVGVGMVDVGDPKPDWQVWLYTRLTGANGELLDNRLHWLPQTGDLVLRLATSPPG